VLTISSSGFNTVPVMSFIMDWLAPIILHVEIPVSSPTWWSSSEYLPNSLWD
jgi:hypothetical protein